MPNLVSDMGVWHAAKEKIGLTNKSKETITYKGEEIGPGEPFIYEGPDREALKMLHEQGSEDSNKNLVMGTDFRKDPDFLQAVRNMGYPNGPEGISQYLESIGFDEKEHKNRFKRDASVIKKHDAPAKHREVLLMDGGGRDHSGNAQNHAIGGFGEERVRPASELKTQGK